MKEPNGVTFDQIFAHVVATMEYRRYPWWEYLPWRIIGRWRGHYLFLRERTPKLSLVGAIRVGFLMSLKAWFNKPQPLRVGDRVRVINDRVAFCMRGCPGTVVSEMLTGGFDYAVRLDESTDGFDGIGGDTFGFFANELQPLAEST